ncbi:GDP-mannose 4,6-dehydratase [Conexibacter sp. CPCC 206217]|uniref:GDP-mannose 4,6-dehydratase n=1 Tax=Conexibacter sp. CPCC 206217 TaxID=3064574 RepID=UPI00271E28FC|nr:GDP-mannose 4,6-dehydratase [Conexibacter sp. CPCC 206217]MDO8210020.1 GDP-mannose 4,6-dehydratase [Conexibacter sp. CPCC 206217]
MSRRRVLITGITGQDGGYLAEQLLAAGDEVIGTVRQPDGALDAAGLGQLAGRVTLLRADLLDPDSVRRAIAEAQPQEIYHLAAPTFVPDSWDDPSAVIAAVATGTATVLAAAGGLGDDVRVLVASSSEVFGDAGVSPQSERSPMRPRSPYGVAKLAAHGLVGTLRARHGRFLVSAITFNHESPRRPERFLPRKVSAGVAAIAAGRADSLTLGDLSAVRDWSDARDVVDGLVRALRHDEAGDYVFASGIPHTVGDLVDAAFAAAGIDRSVPDASAPDGLRDRILVDPRFVRPPERWPPVGDPSKARERLGWRPSRSFEQLVSEMVEADLARLA